MVSVNSSLFRAHERSESVSASGQCQNEDDRIRLWRRGAPRELQAADSEASRVADRKKIVCVIKPAISPGIGSNKFSPYRHAKTALRTPHQSGG
jgi:hypothetical protein